MRFLAGSIAIVLWIASAAENERTVEGNWVGGAEVAGKYVFLRGRIERRDGKLFGMIDAPMRGQSASTEVLAVGKTISFGLPIDRNSLQLKGLADAERIAGSVTRGDSTKVGEAVLRRWTPVDSKILSSYSGDYSVGDSRMIIIQGGRFGIYYYDSETGRYGIGYPSSSTEFFVGPAALHFDRVAWRLSFITDTAGNVLELRLTDGQSSPLKGLPTKVFRAADFVVPNGDIRLGGTVRVPQTHNRHVGIVLIHGSGPQDRSGFNGGLRIHADELARRGFTVLTYDKRGVGSSSGSSDKATYEELKADAVAMVRYLRERSDLRLTQVGVWGISQGGQLAPMVAVAEPSIGFVANTSGTVTNPEEQEIYRTIAQLRSEGLDEATVRDGTTLQILKFYYARTGIGWEGYQEYYQRYHKAPWFEEIIGSPPTKEGAAWAFWRAINVVEPSEFWRQVHVPSLVIFGGRDRLSPVERSVVLFREAMAKAGNQRFEVKIFPEATHDMHEDRSGQINQMTDIQRYQPGYFDYLSSWIIAATALGNSSPERKVEANVITSEHEPKARIRLPRPVQYVGADRWVLYDIADCELHAFVEADKQKNVQRLYWVQFEGYLPSKPDLKHTYESPRHAKIGGMDFYVDTWVRSKDAKMRPGSDREHIEDLIRAKGYQMPAGMMYVRLVHLLDEQKRKELMIIYGEDLKPTGFNTDDLGTDGKAHDRWPTIENALVDRAVKKIAIERISEQ